MELRLLCVAVFIGFAQATTATPSNPRCPAVCICTLPSEATCSSWEDMTPFGLEILTLKIVDVPRLNLTADVFASLRLDSLNRLHIQNSTVVVMDQTALSGLNLIYLSMHNCVLPEIPMLLFASQVSLRLIDFSNSTLKNFRGIYSPTVKELNLQGCGIRDTDKICVGCKQLAYLNLANNFVEQVDFQKMSALDTLNLSNNRIKRVDLNVTDSNLVVLDLSGNPIKSIEGDGDELEVLKIKNCGLKNLEFLKPIVYLVDVDVSNNQLTKIDRSVFEEMLELEYVNLSNNQLTKFDAATFFRNTKLVKIDLSGNKFNTLEDLQSTGRYDSLTYFSCNNCGITSLSPTFFRLAPNLITLSLKHNLITEIPKSFFAYLPKLVKIDFTDNLLTKIETDTFKRNSELKNVNLSKNQLTELSPTVFAYNKMLMFLDVSRCKLRKLWSTTSVSLPKVTGLFADRNLIMKIKVEELEVTKNVQSLTLEGNPFDCSYFKKLHQWVRDNHVMPYKISETLTNELPPMEMQSSWLTICNNDEAYEEDDADADDDDDDDDNDDNYLDESEFEHDYDSPSPSTDTKSQKDDETLGHLDMLMENINDVIDVEHGRFEEREPQTEITIFLLPTIVFLITMLLVLLICSSTILCILYKKNKAKNAPQIKSIMSTWATPKVKKHSGSVYRPLSEEKIPV